MESFLNPQTLKPVDQPVGQGAHEAGALVETINGHSYIRQNGWEP